MWIIQKILGIEKNIYVNKSELPRNEKEENKLWSFIKAIYEVLKRIAFWNGITITNQRVQILTFQPFMVYTYY